MVWLFAAAAFASSIALSRLVFHRAPITSDETSYLFSARAFLDGTIARDPPRLTIPFTSRNSMLIMDDDAGWLSRYPPGHTAWVALGLLVGEPSLATAAAAALGAGLLILLGSLLGIRPWIAGAAALASPFFLFMYGTLLSHTSGFVASAAMLACYLLWQQRNQPGWAALAGLCWSWMFLNRTYTAMLIAVPFGLDALVTLAQRRTRRELAGTIAFAGCALAGVLVLLVYNRLAVGDPWTMTYLYYNPSDTLGFGLRHHQNPYPASPGYVHTPARGFGFMLDNLKLLDHWLWGVPGSLAAWLGLTLFGWTRRWSRLLVAAPASVALGYIAFWFAGWDETGPIYYFEALPMMLVAAGLGLDRVFGWVRTRRPAWQAGLAAALGIAVLVPWTGFVREKTAYIREVTAPRREVLDLYASAPDHSLVFIDDDLSGELWHSHDFLVNPRGTNSRVLVARWMENYVHALIRYYPQRTPFRVVRRGDGFALRPLDPAEPFAADLSLGGMFRATGANLSDPTDATRTIRHAPEGSRPGLLLAAGYQHLYPGRFTVEFDIAAQGEGELGVVDIAGRGGRLVLASTTLTARTTSEPIRFDFELDDFIRVEPRVYYRSGEVSVTAIRLKQAGPPVRVALSERSEE